MICPDCHLISVNCLRCFYEQRSPRPRKEAEDCAAVRFLGFLTMSSSHDASPEAEPEASPLDSAEDAPEASDTVMITFA